MKRLLLLLVGLVSTLVSLSQTPVFWKFGEDNGLNTSNIYDIHIDRKGYLWLGTESGLFRFNGQEFKEYKAVKDKGNFKSNIREDKYGKIWCENTSGQIFYVENDELKLLDFSSYADLFVTDYVIDINNKLYIQDRLEKVLEVDLLTMKVYNLMNKVTNFKSMGSFVSFDELDGKLYIIEAEPELIRLWRYSDGKFRIVDKVYLQNEFLQPIFYKVTNYNQTLHISNKYGNDFYWVDSGKIKQFIFEPELTREHKINRISIDNSGNYLLSTTLGAKIYKKVNDTLYLQNDIFPNTNITDFIQDEYNRYWISTYSKGLYLTPNVNLQIQNEIGNQQIFSNATSMSSFKEKSLLFGMSNGSVIHYDLKNNFVEYKNRLQREIEQFYLDTVDNILYFSSMAYKFGENENPISMPLDLNPGSVKKFDKIGNQLVLATNINSLIINFEDSVKTPSGKIWNGKEQRKEKIYGRTAYVLKIGSTRTRTLLYDKNLGNLWIAFSGGLTFFDKDGNEYTLNYKNTELYVYSMAQDINGMIWIGTGDRGTFGIMGSEVVRSLNKSNGLNDNFCKGVYTKGSKLYISTDKGLNIVDLKTYDIKIYNKSNGLISSNIIDIAFTEGKVWVLTTKGLTSITEGSEDQIPQIIPKFYINNVFINDEDTIISNYYNLSYYQNSITVELSGTYLNYLESFSYEYRLKGLDNNWYSQNSLNPYLRFPSLPSGNYTLEVKAISPEGKESDMSYAIQFDIGFPIWKSWWFIMLMIFMGIVFISTIFNQRLKSIEKRNNLELEKSIIEQELRSSQLASLKVQMNPHFIFNALNSIQDFILSNDKKQANNYLSKFARLMRKTLDLSNERSNLLSDELEVIQLYLELEAVRFEENFEYLMSVDKEINANEISIPSMLIQPFVENAIKHGLLHKKGFKKLNICFKLSEDKNALVCEITDNGIGIEKSKMLNSENKINHRSFSTGATQKRLDLLNLGRKNIIALKFEDLSGIDDAEATGTKVVLEIPFKEF